MDAKQFGIYLSNTRKQNGFTQMELAKKIHVTDKAISKWERGIGLPDINNIEPLALALGVSVADVMSAGENKVDNHDDIAVKNTILMAKSEKKRTFKKELSILFIYIALKAIVATSFDTNPSSYNHLPMFVVRTLLLIYIIFTIFFTIHSFKKDKRI